MCESQLVAHYFFLSPSQVSKRFKLQRPISGHHALIRSAPRSQSPLQSSVPMQEQSFGPDDVMQGLIGLNLGNVEVIDVLRIDQTVDVRIGSDNNALSINYLPHREIAVAIDSFGLEAKGLGKSHFAVAVIDLAKAPECDDWVWHVTFPHI